MIDIEDNENCGYFPVQVFEAQGKPRSASSVIVPNVPGSSESHEVVGWCSENGGSPCEVTVVLVGDSGSGQALMVYGGDYGVRLRQKSSQPPWDLDDPNQIGEPYITLSAATNILFH